MLLGYLLLDIALHVRSLRAHLVVIGEFAGCPIAVGHLLSKPRKCQSPDPKLLVTIPLKKELNLLTRVWQMPLYLGLAKLVKKFPDQSVHFLHISAIFSWCQRRWTPTLKLRTII
jgi:hypothetical protein